MDWTLSLPAIIWPQIAQELELRRPSDMALAAICRGLRTLRHPDGERGICTVSIDLKYANELLAVLRIGASNHSLLCHDRLKLAATELAVAMPPRGSTCLAEPRPKLHAAKSTTRLIRFDRVWEAGELVGVVTDNATCSADSNKYYVLRVEHGPAAGRHCLVRKAFMTEVSALELLAASAD